MAQEIMTDDSSHYEISLTAGQAFLAFVLLLFSLAAAFAFGLMIGKGQVDERLVVKREPTIITEGTAAAKAKANEARIVELGSDDETKVDAPVATPVVKEETTTAAPQITITEGSAATSSTDQAAAPQPAVTAPATTHPAVVEHSEAHKPAPPAPTVVEKKPVTPPVAAVTAKSSVYAQLLSSGDAKAAETLAARLIDGGFTSAYVERPPSPTGMIYRVRVKFPSEEEAHAASDRLRTIAKADPWITKQ